MNGSVFQVNDAGGEASECFVSGDVDFMRCFEDGLEIVTKSGNRVLIEGDGASAIYLSLLPKGLIEAGPVASVDYVEINEDE